MRSCRAPRAQKENGRKGVLGNPHKCRAHAHEEVKVMRARATREIMVSPMGNFFTLHVITARGANERGGGGGGMEREGSKETKCLLCAEEQFNKISLA